MKNKLTPRFLIIALVIIWAIYALWPTVRFQTLSEAEKETLRTEGKLDKLEARTIKQGLDLKGGMFIVLEVNLPTLMSNLAVNKDLKFERALRTVQDQLKADPKADFFSLFAQTVENQHLKLSRYYYELGSDSKQILSSLKKEADDAIDRVLEILQNRVDQFVVSEPTIQNQGNLRIIVELAGVQDPERARALLESTALLEFYIVKDPEVTNSMLLRIDQVLKGNDDLAEVTKDTTLEVQTPEEEAPVSEDKTVSVSELFGETEAEAVPAEADTAVVDERLFKERPFSSLLRNLGQNIGVPEKNVYAVKKILELPEVQERLVADNGQFLFSDKAQEYSLVDGGTEKLYILYYLERKAEITGGVIEDATANLGQQGSSALGQPVVNLSMNSEGARKWAIVTGANVGKKVAIVLDKKVHMAPNIKEKIRGGGTLIEGFANMNEAKDIAIVLRAGALPAPVDIIEERIVGPSLGADSVRKGTYSVVVGLAMVLLFMLVYYKWSGLVADFALIWNIVLVLAILASLSATLTLPGIAGLILTVGMSIDANVIIFERIREELKKGKTPRAAVNAGYDRALTTIVDANITTVIAALVLWQFGTGPIRGFATVLFWGIVISMFTAIFVTRTIFAYFTGRQTSTKLSI